MLTTPYKKIFSKASLKEALTLIKSKGSGIDKEFLDDFKKYEKLHIKALNNELLDGIYSPEPIKKISIPKNDKEYRPIALASVRDKVVQRALVMAIEPYFDKLMSNKSYGYRHDKSSLKAIGRCSDFINRGYFWVYKSDIDNYFETINHDRLLNILGSHIEDKKIIKLISLYLENGGFKNYNYIDHNKGVHQGDILSPLLSNIYLNEMDMFLDIGDDKSYKAYIFEHGFSFLGVHFKDKDKSIDNERLLKKVSKLFEIARESKNPKEFVSKVNLFLDGIQRYYLKIIKPNSTQFELLYNAIIDSSAQFVFLQRKAEKLKNKKDFKEPFIDLYLLKETSITQHKDIVERIISRGFEKYLATKEYTKDSSKILAKKQKYTKSFASSSTLYVSQFGAYLGMSKNSIIVKLKGKVVAKIPKRLCEHIIIAGKAISISSNMIYLCVKEGIAIDFVDGRDKPFASILSPKTAYPKMALRQLELIKSNKSLDLAKKFIYAKAKNQLNYLKYLDKYHQEIDKEIDFIEYKVKNSIKKATTVAQLMGYEGEISAIYWQSLATILKDKINFENRNTRGAKDIVNASLNYAYAILYSRIQNALLKAGLALNVSFLHSIQEGKPTLVYDCIEEFRAFIVDRAIVSMFNKNEALKINAKGELSKSSCELIVKNVKERLGVYSKYRKASKKVDNIIQDQAYLLARHIKGEAKYKPFIGKY